MDNSLKTKEKPTGSGGLTPPAKHKTKTFLIGKELKTKDLRQTAAERGKRTDNKTQPKTRIKTPDSRQQPLRSGLDSRILTAESRSWGFLRCPGRPPPRSFHRSR